MTTELYTLDDLSKTDRELASQHEPTHVGEVGLFHVGNGIWQWKARENGNSHGPIFALVEKEGEIAVRRNARLTAPKPCYFDNDKLDKCFLAIEELLGQASRGGNHTAGFYLKSAWGNLKAAHSAFRVAQAQPRKGYNA